MRQLIVESHVALGLVLIDWWMQSVSRRFWGCCPPLLVEARSWISARLLEDRARSLSLVAASKGLRASVSFLGV